MITLNVTNNIIIFRMSIARSYLRCVCNRPESLLHTLILYSNGSLQHRCTVQRPASVGGGADGVGEGGAEGMMVHKDIDISRRFNLNVVIVETTVCKVCDNIYF